MQFMLKFVYEFCNKKFTHLLNVSTLFYWSLLYLIHILLKNP